MIQINLIEPGSSNDFEGRRDDVKILLVDFLCR